MKIEEDVLLIEQLDCWKSHEFIRIDECRENTFAYYWFNQIINKLGF